MPSLLWSLLACSPSAELQVLSATDLGPIETSARIKARDGGYSFPFEVEGERRSVWVYGDSVLNEPGADGSSWRDNTWSWTADLVGLSGFTEPTDSAGGPTELFPETEAEAAYNAAHSILREDCEEPCGAREILWPMAGVWDPERQRALVFYVKIHGEPGEWNFFARGVGVAVWEDFDAGPTRPEVNPGAEHPTLLFTEPGQDFGAAALLEDDTVYAYGCEPAEGWGKPCRVARVPAGEVLDRGAWRFWDGRAWSEDVEDAAEVFEGNSQLTVHWSEALQRYLAVHVDGVSDDVVLRTAPAPEGPWSTAELAFTALPAADEGFVYCGLGHGELQREGGAVETVSYYRGTGDWTGEVRVVELELDTL